MSKRIEKVLDAVRDEKWFPLYGYCLCLLALLLARDAGFTWGQVFDGLLIYVLWKSGSRLSHDPANKRKFQRIQFTIHLTHLGQALIDAGIYTEDEVKQNEGALLDSLESYSNGLITFTWLQPDLFFMDAGGVFDKSPGFMFSLKPFGMPAGQVGNQLKSSGHITFDCKLDRILKVAPGMRDYELRLVNDSRSPRDEEDQTVTLMTIPNDLFWHLQEPCLYRWNDRKTKDHLKHQDEMLERVGLKYVKTYRSFQYEGTYAVLSWRNF